MKRLLIFSDSLGLPRNTPEVTLYEDTYPFLLRKNFEVFQFSKGGGLITDFVEQSWYYVQYKPDILLLQMGIVDCGPRAFSKGEEAIFSSVFFLRGLRRLLSRYRVSRMIRNVRKKSWTKPKIFRKSCESLIEMFPDASVFALSIIHSSPSYEKQVPGITDKISQYNEILKEVFGDHYIDLKEIPSLGIMSDHHHLTKEGHRYIYDMILKTLEG